MMKRFEKIGKIAGLMLLALAFVFAGCQGAGDSSSSGGGLPTIGTDSGVQLAVDPTPGSEAMYIGETGMSQATTVDGHDIEILNGATNGGACSGTGGGDVKCWIKLINRDPSMGMTNTFMNHTGCVNCTSAQFNGADFCGAPGDTCVRNGYDAPVDTSIDGSGFCFAEVGRYIPILQKPFNQYGCNLNPAPNFSSKPVQVIHPKCGQVSVLYDFANQTELYTFNGSISADYFPWNPVGSDGIPATGDDDPRYDFQNYTTVYLILADFGSRAGASTLYTRGSYQRSNVLAGWGAPGMRSGYTVTSPGGDPLTDAYFSLNIAVEYPDRVESQVMGDPLNFNAVTGYEYYGTYAVFLRWDPTVVQPVTVAKNPIWNTFRVPCWVQGQCNTAGRANYQHLDAFSQGTMGQVNPGNGYIYFYRQGKDTFAAYSTYVNYQTNGLGIIKVYGGNNMEGGAAGVAHWNPAYVGGTIYATNANGRVQEGPDPAPEVNLLNYHFWTLPGTSGRGTSIKVDSFAGYTVFLFSHTGTTFYPSGTAQPTDWSQYCAPFSAGFGDPTNQWCNPALGQSDYAVYQGTENQKANLPEMGGEAVQGGLGGPQNWSVYVCVQ